MDHKPSQEARDPATIYYFSLLAYRTNTWQKQSTAFNRKIMTRFFLYKVVQIKTRLEGGGGNWAMPTGPEICSTHFGGRKWMSIHMFLVLSALNDPLYDSGSGSGSWAVSSVPSRACRNSMPPHLAGTPEVWSYAQTRRWRWLNKEARNGPKNSSRNKVVTVNGKVKKKMSRKFCSQAKIKTKVLLEKEN